MSSFVKLLYNAGFITLNHYAKILNYLADKRKEQR